MKGPNTELARFLFALMRHALSAQNPADLAPIIAPVRERMVQAVLGAHFRADLFRMPANPAMTDEYRVQLVGWTETYRPYAERDVDAMLSVLTEPEQRYAYCEVTQFSDQMHCARCALTWDVNESDPPLCGMAREQARQSNG
jgi:hypothetical protein